MQETILCADVLSYLPPAACFVRALSADFYLLADDIQFSTNGYSQRARIKTASGVSVLTAPVFTKGRGPQSIKDVELDRDRHWRRRHWRSIEVNYCHAPYFDQFADALHELFEKPYQRLSEMNLAFFKALWQWLKMPTMPRLTSEFPSLLKKEERLIELSQKFGAGIYLCDESYRHVLSGEIFKKAGMQLRFADFSGAAYPQLFGQFQPDLSVLDLLLNEGPQTARSYLDLIARRVRLEIVEGTLCK